MVSSFFIALFQEMAVAGNGIIFRKDGNLALPPLYLRVHAPASTIPHLSLAPGKERYKEGSP